MGAISVLTARPVVFALEQRGIDPGPVLRTSHLSREALASHENRLPAQTVQRLWEAAAIACRDRSFGVHVAEALPPGALDLYDYLISTAANVGEGLARVADYGRVIDDRATLRLAVEPRGARLVSTVPTPALQYDEFAVTLLLVRTRQASGVDWSPERLAVQHERPGDDGELARVFGCPVTCGAPQTELRFKRSVLALPHLHADSRLATILARYASQLRDRLPPKSSLVARASHAIANRIAQGLPSLATTARVLAMPERTLQRRLSDHGVTHSSLVDEVRRSLALKQIGDAGVTITEISYRLHFADPTAFYRAFKRWTGQSPRGYRDRLFSDHDR
jgi:AraC-like DNA-binding protein